MSQNNISLPKNHTVYGHQILINTFFNTNVIKIHFKIKKIEINKTVQLLTLKADQGTAGETVCTLRSGNDHLDNWTRMKKLTICTVFDDIKI